MPLGHLSRRTYSTTTKRNLPGDRRGFLGRNEKGSYRVKERVNTVSKSSLLYRVGRREGVEGGGLTHWESWVPSPPTVSTSPPFGFGRGPQDVPPSRTFRTEWEKGGSGRQSTGRGRDLGLTKVRPPSLRTSHPFLLRPGGRTVTCLTRLNHTNHFLSVDRSSQEGGRGRVGPRTRGNLR